jgi:hypothetical protein
VSAYSFVNKGTDCRPILNQPTRDPPCFRLLVESVLYLPGTEGSTLCALLLKFTFNLDYLQRLRRLFIIVNDKPMQSLTYRPQRVGKDRSSHWFHYTRNKGHFDSWTDPPWPRNALHGRKCFYRNPEYHNTKFKRANAYRGYRFQRNRQECYHETIRCPYSIIETDRRF